MHEDRRTECARRPIRQISFSSPVTAVTRVAIAISTAAAWLRTQGVDFRGRASGFAIKQNSPQAEQQYVPGSLFFMNDGLRSGDVLRSSLRAQRAGRCSGTISLLLLGGFWWGRSVDPVIALSSGLASHSILSHPQAASSLAIERSHNRSIFLCAECRSRGAFARGQVTVGCNNDPCCNHGCRRRPQLRSRRLGLRLFTSRRRALP